MKDLLAIINNINTNIHCVMMYNTKHDMMYVSNRYIIINS
jgi:hypothetical protein